MFFKVFSSYYTMFILFLLLAFFAGVGTFVEKELGNTKAMEYIYSSFWYELLLLLASLNLLITLFQKRIYKSIFKFTFHIAFVVILIGAGITRYFGYDGILHIRESQEGNITRALKDGSIFELPFKVRLNDFKLSRYYGSNSPSNYSSSITIIDKNESIDFEVSMNQTVVYRGYKFFQTSYDKDELGTMLTVNRDEGKWITYLGYFLLIFGLILNLFQIDSRFQKLLKSLNKTQIIFILLFSYISNANSGYLDEYKSQSIEVSNSFGELSVQSRMGRMKPMEILNRELLRKLSTQESLYGLSANQIILGMFIKSHIFKNLPLIKVKHQNIKNLIGIDRDLIAFNEFFKENNYLLASEIERVSYIKPSKRDSYESELIKVDERINIAFMIFSGDFFKFFPLINDSNFKWANFKEAWESLDGELGDDIRVTIQKFIDSGFNQDYKILSESISKIKIYQKESGGNLTLSDRDIAFEIALSKINILPNLRYLYLIIASIGFFVAFGSIFSKKILNYKIYKYLIYITIFVVTIHTLSLIFRWYIAGYTPLSNTYESIVYIAYSSAFFGVLLFRKSLFILASAMLMAVIFMFIAHLNDIDPEITNLVPVLKSFWLTLHVSIITASYGFFAISSLVGGVILILFILKNHNTKSYILELTKLNELSLILGLTLLIIGTLLGGIWANESWGRYWAWDPKESWSYISILIYSLLIHLRLIKNLYSDYLFALSSMLSFLTILMTYFGVNFYLSGKHSYANIDFFEIPISIYITFIVILLIIVFSYTNRKI